MRRLLEWVTIKEKKEKSKNSLHPLNITFLDHQEKCFIEKRIEPIGKNIFNNMSHKYYNCIFFSFDYIYKSLCNKKRLI